MHNVISDPQWHRGTNADASVTNFRGYHALAGAGDMMLGEVLNAIPFGNAAVDLASSGDDLWDASEGIVSKVSQFDGRVDTSFVRVSKDIKFKDNPVAAAGSRLVEFSINGTPVTASNTTTYKFTIWDLPASGGDNFWPRQSDYHYGKAGRGLHCLFGTTKSSYWRIEWKDSHSPSALNSQTY